MKINIFILSLALLTASSLKSADAPKEYSEGFIFALFNPTRSRVLSEYVHPNDKQRCDYPSGHTSIAIGYQFKSGERVFRKQEDIEKEILAGQKNPSDTFTYKE